MATLGELNVLISLKGLSTFKRQLKEVSGELKDTGKDGAKSFTSMEQPIRQTRKQVDSFGASLKTFNRDLRSVSQGLNAVQQSAQLLSVSILGPLTLALNEASKRDRDLNIALESVKKTSSEFASSIGSSLLPIIKEFDPFLKGLVSEFTSLPKSQRDVIVKTIAMTGAFSGVVAIVARFSRALIGLGRIVATPGGIIVGGFAVIVGLLASMSKFIDRITGKTSAFKNFLGGVGQVGKFVGGAAKVGLAASKPVAKTGMEVMGAFGAGVKSGISGDQESLSPAQPNAFKEALGGARQALQELKSEVDSVFGEMATQLPTVAKTVADAMEISINGFTASFGEAIAQSIVFGKDFGETMKSMLKNVAAEVISFLATTIAKIIVLRALGVVGPIFAGAIGLGGGPSSGVGGGPSSGVGGGGSSSGSKGGLFNLGFLGLAEGGIVSKPTLAVVGEGSEPEVVAPLSELDKMGGGNITISFNGHTFLNDESSIDKLVRKIKDGMKRASDRRTGGSNLAF